MRESERKGAKERERERKREDGEGVSVGRRIEGWVGWGYGTRDHSKPGHVCSFFSISFTVINNLPKKVLQISAISSQSQCQRERERERERECVCERERERVSEREREREKE